MSSTTNKLVSSLSEINTDRLPSFSSVTSNSVSVNYYSYFSFFRNKCIYLFRNGDRKNS